MTKKKLGWEPGEGLGESLEHAKLASEAEMQELDKLLGLQPVTIRLPKRLVAGYKYVAEFHGIGYQPLMRDILDRWLKEGLKEVTEAQAATSEAAGNRVRELQKKVA